MDRFITISNESKKVKVYSSFYLTEPVSKMPYLNWETDLKFLGNQASFESEHWNFANMGLINQKNGLSCDHAEPLGISGVQTKY